MGAIWSKFWKNEAERHLCLQMRQGLLWRRVALISPQALNGSLTMIAGPMFAGKTTRLIRIAQTTMKTVHVFKPAFDKRYDELALVSHDGLRLAARPISDLDEMVEAIVIADDERLEKPLCLVDEVQFLKTRPELLADGMQKLLANSCSVVCAGLDLDHAGHPFEISAWLVALAD